jgi:hypothetical protein
MKRAPALSRSGSALFLALLTTSILSSLCLCLLATASAGQRGLHRSTRDLSTFYVAEAGLGEAAAILQKSGKAGLQSAAYPKSLSSLSYTVNAIYGDADATLADDRIVLLSSANDGRVKSSVELVVKTIPTTQYRWAAFGDEYAKIHSNAYTDSYDSTTGTYASQASGGHAKSRGDVGSNANVTLSSNAKVWGNATPGPTGSVSSAANSSISGSTTPASSLVTLPAITVPSIASSGSLTVSGTQTLGPGTFHYTSISTNSNAVLNLVGPITLVVDNFDLKANSTASINASGGKVQIYGTENFELKSNSTLTDNAVHARDVAVYLTGNNISGSSTLTFSSNASFVGTIYAPNGDATISSNFAVYGSVMAKRLTLSSNSIIHYDEDLLNDTSNGPPAIQTVSWRRLSPQQAKVLGAP